MIETFNLISAIILQEWAIRTFGVAFFGWISVVVIRVIRYGKNPPPKKRKKIIETTRVLYLPFNTLWSIIFTLRYAGKLLEKKKQIDMSEMLWWFLIYGLLAIGAHLIWARGIAPFSDNKFKTNWLGNKDKKK